MLILGLILAGAGTAAWMYADPNLAFLGGGLFSVEESRIMDAGGVGATVIGIGLALGGIIRMIMKK